VRILTDDPPYCIEQCLDMTMLFNQRMCCSWVIPGAIAGWSWAVATDANARPAMTKAIKRRVDGVLKTRTSELIGFEELERISAKAVLVR
jgi:siroheme synthase (precorrin-2 oxidase/ferrochelatase)